MNKSTTNGTGQGFDEFAAVIVERTIKVHGKESKVFVQEISSEVAETLFDILGPDGKVDKAKSKGLRNRVIAACIVNRDGTPKGTEQEAAKIPVAKANELQRIAMQVNGFTPDAVETAAKNS
jgi:ribosomal protein L14